MLKAIIFDMDGTLINSEPMHFEAWTRAMAKRGIELDYDVYKPCIGSTIKFLMGLFHEHYGIALDDYSVRDDMFAIKKQIIEERGFVPLVSGVYEMLKDFHEAGYQLAVASSSPAKYIKEVVQAHHIEKYFTILCSSESVKAPKPAPDVFLLAAEELGVKPEECLVVEDSMNGCLAAKAAGMACIGFYNPDSGVQDLSSATIVVEGFEEVESCFAEYVYCRHHDLPVTIGQSARLCVREMTMGDLKTVWELCQAEDIADCTEDFKGTYEAAKEWFPSYKRSMYEFCDMGNWLITEKSTGEILGRVGLQPVEAEGIERTAELGYALRSDWRGQKLAQEAGRIAMDKAAALEIQRVYCRIRRENTASVRVAEALGFVLKKEQDDILWYENVLS